MTTLEQSKPDGEARDSVLRIGAVSSCNDLLPGQFVNIINGDCRTVLKELAPESIQCVVTSPPYWGLRDYGHADQIGQEETPDAYVETMRQVFAEIWRVLKDDGTAWLNLGDSYARNGGTPGGGNRELMHMEGTQSRMCKIPAGAGLKVKDLVGIPWLVALALRADGWYLRQDIIWHKPSTMPESVTDRCTKAHEYIFLLTKSQKYYFDNEAIKEPSDYPDDDRKGRSYDHHKSAPPVERNGVRSGNYLDSGRSSYAMRNKRSVWSVTNAGYSEAHFATFPPDLIKPCILAGTKPGDVVLDPFGGSGTTGMVALELGRRAVLVELNPDYAKLCDERCTTTRGLPLAG